MDNQGPNNGYNNNGSNNGGSGGKDNRNGQLVMAFILISLILLFVMTMVTNQFSQMSTAGFLHRISGDGKRYRQMGGQDG